jgi:hypothetical protein
MRMRTTPGARGQRSPRPVGRPARRLVGALAAAAAAGGGLAGCGGQAQEIRDAGAYATRVDRVQGGFERDLDDVRRAAARARERSDVERAVDRLSTRVDVVGRDLAAIRPPASIADAHRALVAAYAGWKAPLTAFRRALRDRDPRAAVRARTAFGTDATNVDRRVNAAAQRINDELRDLSD